VMCMALKFSTETGVCAPDCVPRPEERGSPSNCGVASIVPDSKWSEETILAVKLCWCASSQRAKISTGKQYYFSWKVATNGSVTFAFVLHDSVASRVW
jgi:hypothetical protein